VVLLSGGLIIRTWLWP